MQSYLLWSQSVPEGMFQDDEEMLKGDVIGIELSSKFQARIDDFLYNQLKYVDEIAPFDNHWISLWNNKGKMRDLENPSGPF